MIDRVLIVNGSNQRCCLFRVKEPAGISVHVLTAKTRLLLGLEHMLKIQAVAADSSSAEGTDMQRSSYLIKVIARG